MVRVGEVVEPVKLPVPVPVQLFHAYCSPRDAFGGEAERVTVEPEAYQFVPDGIVDPKFEDTVS